MLVAVTARVLCPSSLAWKLATSLELAYVQVADADCMDDHRVSAAVLQSTL